MGLIKPTHRPGSLEETIRLLPEGIGVIPVTVGLAKGTRAEFLGTLDAIEQRVAELAELGGVDLIAPAGAPPFMVHGYAGEGSVIDAWSKRYGVPIVTAGMTQVLAMRALGVRRIVGLSYFTGALNDDFARYFTDAGIEVLSMSGIDVQFNKVQQLSSWEVYRHAKATYLAHPAAEAIYLLGGGWRILDIIEQLEQDCEVPVLHAVACRVWATQRHFRTRQTRTGYGQLLAELPPFAA
jgi:maleate isomerase